MKIFAEIDNKTNLIIRKISQSDDWIAPTNKYGTNHETKFLPVIENEKPDYNPLTHMIIPGNTNVYEDKVEIEWNIIPIPGPTEVPLWAFRAILTILNIAPQVESLINSLPEPQKTVANVQWQYGNYIERNHPLINSLGSELGLTKEQIDNIFLEASKLK